MNQPELIFHYPIIVNSKKQCYYILFQIPEKQFPQLSATFEPKDTKKKIEIPKLVITYGNDDIFLSDVKDSISVLKTKHKKSTKTNSARKDEYEKMHQFFKRINEQENNIFGFGLFYDCTKDSENINLITVNVKFGDHEISIKMNTVSKLKKIIDDNNSSESSVYDVYNTKITDLFRRRSGRKDPILNKIETIKKYHAEIIEIFQSTQLSTKLKEILPTNSVEVVLVRNVQPVIAGPVTPAPGTPAPVTPPETPITFTDEVFNEIREAREQYQQSSRVTPNSSFDSDLLQTVTNNEFLNDDDILNLWFPKKIYVNTYEDYYFCVIVKSRDQLSFHGYFDYELQGTSISYLTENVCPPFQLDKVYDEQFCYIDILHKTYRNTFLPKKKQSVFWFKLNIIPHHANDGVSYKELNLELLLHFDEVLNATVNMTIVISEFEVLSSNSLDLFNNLKMFIDNGFMEEEEEDNFEFFIPSSQE